MNFGEHATVNKMVYPLYSTGKALAGGISTAKGALSSWITSFKQPHQNLDSGRDAEIKNGDDRTPQLDLSETEAAAEAGNSIT